MKLAFDTETHRDWEFTELRFKNLKKMSHLKAGEAAPNFSAPNEKGAMTSLADFAGKKLVLYFYPKDDTPGCTAESCNLRDNYHQFLAKGYEVLGVSPDSPKKHVKFIEKYNLPFSLLADETHEVAEAYGVWGEKKFMGRSYMGILRTTFVIDEAGKIAEVISNVDTANHTSQLLAG